MKELDLNTVVTSKRFIRRAIPGLDREKGTHSSLEYD
jgi:hypothetical protein